MRFGVVVFLVSFCCVVHAMEDQPFVLGEKFDRWQAVQTNRDGVTCQFGFIENKEEFEKLLLSKREEEQKECQGCTERFVLSVAPNVLRGYDLNDDLDFYSRYIPCVICIKNNSGDDVEIELEDYFGKKSSLDALDHYPKDGPEYDTKKNSMLCISYGPVAIACAFGLGCVLLLGELPPNLLDAFLFVSVLYFYANVLSSIGTMLFSMNYLLVASEKKIRRKLHRVCCEKKLQNCVVPSGGQVVAVMFVDRENISEFKDNLESFCLDI